MTTPGRLLDFFSLEASEYLARLEAMANRRSLESSEAAQFAAAARGLRGSATMAKAGELARLAAAVERIASGIVQGVTTWEPEVQRALVGAVEDLKVLVRSVRSWGAEQDARVEEAVGRLGRYGPAREERKEDVILPISQLFYNDDGQHIVYVAPNPRTHWANSSSVNRAAGSDPARCRRKSRTFPLFARSPSLRPRQRRHRAPDAAARSELKGCSELQPRHHALTRDPKLRAAAERRAGSNSATIVSRTARDRARRRDSSRTQEERNSADTGAGGRARRSGRARLGRVAVASAVAGRARGSAERGADLLDAARNLANRSRTHAFPS